MSTAIKIENLYKEYRLGVIGHGTLYRDLQSWWAKVQGREDPNSMIGSGDRTIRKIEEDTGASLDVNNDGTVTDCILALNDINLDVKDGEVLGIIGRNGAGKSTMLKILSRVTAPTKGQIKVKGRVASLLEVGTGFHSELTGRENIYLNGAINGMDKKEVAKKLDEIVDFAGVEKFLDTPVKRYSSGMHVRLGFAVAAHLEPEILVVDEVLAVGDHDFQKKCLTKMGNVASQGRTILFVSHNLGSVRELCSRAVLLEGGRKIREGETGEIISYYTGNRMKYYPEKDADSPLFENNIVRLIGVRSLTASGEACNTFTVREKIYVQIEFEVLTYMKLLEIHLLLWNQRNENILIAYDEQNKSSTETRERKPGKYISTCKIPGDFLNHGNYHVQVKLEDEIKTYFQEDLCFFLVSDSKDPEGARGITLLIQDHLGNWPPGVVVRQKLKWDVNYRPF